jgi:hypothetical protein
MTEQQRNRIMIFGPKSDGSYVIEFRTTAGESWLSQFLCGPWRASHDPAARANCTDFGIVFLRKGAPAGVGGWSWGWDLSINRDDSPPSLQADRLGELDADSRRLLDRIGSGPAERIDRLVADFNLPRTELRPGTLLTREWDGHLQRVMVLADGFAWNGKTYRSLSKVAFAMTGTRWSGPRFFGLDQPPSERRP